MSIDIKLHKKDLPDDFKVSNTIAVDCEMGGLNVKRDPLFLVQISLGNLDAHIIQLNRENYKAPKLLIGTGTKPINIDDIQVEGKKRLQASQFILGTPEIIGGKFH